MNIRSLAVSALAATTLVASAQSLKPSIAKQIELGESAAAQVRKEEKILPASDPRVKEIQRIGAKLVAQIPEDEQKSKPFKYTFDIIENDQVNAFAFPGGPSFMYTGLLNKFQYEDEIAGVLAHEITHARHEHWARQYESALKRQLGITILLTLLRANDEWYTVGAMYDSLQGLQYSRGDELDADETGYDLVVKAGYNPQGMVSAFNKILAVGGSRPPEFISTHPDMKNRITKIEARMKEYRQRFPAMKKRRTAASTVQWQNGYPRLLQKGGSPGQPSARD